jgi:hypothetical protein
MLGGLLLINLFGKSLWQLGDIRSNPPRLAFGEVLGCGTAAALVANSAA